MKTIEQRLWTSALGHSIVRSGRRRRVGRRHGTRHRSDCPSGPLDHGVRSERSPCSRSRGASCALRATGLADGSGRSSPHAPARSLADVSLAGWTLGYFKLKPMATDGETPSAVRSRRCSACCGPAERSSSSRRWAPDSPSPNRPPKRSRRTIDVLEEELGFQVDVDAHRLPV